MSFLNPLIGKANEIQKEKKKQVDEDKMKIV